jgi:Icc-related predicted phosphoesterase
VPIDGKLRIAAVGDLHCRLDKEGHFRRLVDAVNEQQCDALVLCGDLTDHGHIDEAKLLAESLSRVRAPKVGVLGNHDHEAGKGDEICQILGEAGIRILDGDHFELKGHMVGFAGAKGFCGGFDRATLQGFGESCIKHFVQETVQEALKLETALLRVDAPIKIAVTHYSPVRATVVGENPEIFPFLGSSRLAEPLDAYQATMAFHGHAHHGTIEGRTLGGVPVYNVAMPLLRKADPDRRVFMVEIPIPEGWSRAQPGGTGAVVTPADLHQP